MTVNELSLKGESLNHSFKSLVISSMYLLPDAFFRQKTPSFYICQKNILFLCQKIILIIYEICSAGTKSTFCDQLYSLATFTVSFSVGGWLITTTRACQDPSLYLSLLVWCFKPASGLTHIFNSCNKSERLTH